MTKKDVIQIVLAFVITMAIIFGLYGLAALMAPPKAGASPMGQEICSIFDDFGTSPQTIWNLQKSFAMQGYSAKTGSQMTFDAITEDCPWYYDDVKNSVAVIISMLPPKEVVK